MGNADQIGSAFQLRTHNQKNIDLVPPYTLGFARNSVTTTEATRTLTAVESGTTFHCTASSGTQNFTLPAATAGLEFTFVCGNASGEILITPVAGDAVRTMAFAAVGATPTTAAVAPAAGTGIKNTAATNVIGDTITLRALDETTWQGMSIAAGIWASQ